MLDQRGVSLVSLIMGAALGAFLILTAVTSTSFMEQNLQNIEKTLTIGNYIDNLSRYLSDVDRCTAVFTGDTYVYGTSAVNFSADGFEVGPSLPAAHHYGFKFVFADLIHSEKVVVDASPRQNVARLTLTAQRTDAKGNAIDNSTVRFEIPLTVWSNFSDEIVKCHGRSLVSTEQHCPVGAIEFEEAPGSLGVEPGDPRCGFSSFTSGVTVAMLPGIDPDLIENNRFYSQGPIRALDRLEFVRGNTGADPTVLICDSAGNNCKDVCLIDDGSGGTNCNTNPPGAHPMDPDSDFHHSEYSRCEWSGAVATTIDNTCINPNQCCIEMLCPAGDVVVGYTAFRTTVGIWNDYKQVIQSQDLSAGRAGVRFCVHNNPIAGGYNIRGQARCCEKSNDPPFIE